MRTKHLGRILGAACLAGSFLLAASGSASASPPGWVMTVENIPLKVAPGAGAAYKVTITNKGRSNISSLYLGALGTQDTPVFAVPDKGTCPTGPLNCNLGALGSQQQVSVVVGYHTPTSGTGFNPSFFGSTTGITGSDGGTSHGDFLTANPPEVPTVLDASGDLGGGFAFSAESVSNNQDLSDTNKQGTGVVPPPSAVNMITTVEDGPAVSFNCKKVCQKAFGEWSAINVGDGQNFGDTFFSITLLLRASDAPTNLSQIKLAHVLDDNKGTVVLDQCTTDVLENCIVVTKVGTNVQIKAYVNENGGIRGIR